jgi:hypothetical protein
MEDEALNRKQSRASSVYRTNPEAPILSNPVNPVKNHPAAKAWTERMAPLRVPDGMI